MFDINSKDLLQDEVISLRNALDEMSNLINEIPEKDTKHSYNSLLEQIENMNNDLTSLKNTVIEFKLSTYGKRGLWVPRPKKYIPLEDLKGLKTLITEGWSYELIAQYYTENGLKMGRMTVSREVERLKDEGLI